MRACGGRVGGLGPAILSALAGIGRAAARRPRAALVLTLALAAVMAAGVGRIQVDDSLHGLFRARTAEYADYRRYVALFPSSEFDVVVALDGLRLADPAHIEAMRELVMQLGLVDGVASVTSLLSMRERADGGGLVPLVPDELPEGAALADLARRIEVAPLVRGRLLAPTGSGALALVVAGLDRAALASEGAAPVVARLQAVVRGVALPAGVGAGLTGVPLVKLEIARATRRDAVTFSSAGALVAMLVNALFFRRLRLAAIANLAPLLCVLLVVGVFGWAGGRLDPLTTAILPMILVITATDAVHLVSAIDREMRRGAPCADATIRAVGDVGPACALTSITTAVALGGLLVSESELIRSFGVTAAAATLLSFLAMMLTVPALAVLLLSGRHAGSPDGSVRSERTVGRAGIMLYAGVRRCPVGITAAFLAAMALLAVLYADVAPSFRLSDQVSPRHETSEVTRRIGRALSGTQPIAVMIELAPGTDMLGEGALGLVAGVHRAIEVTPGIRQTTSLATLGDWLAAIGYASADARRAEIERLPPDIVGRFVDRAGAAALVEGLVGDLPSEAIAAICDGLEARLALIRAAAPGARITVTGLPVLAARRSARLIGQLSGGLIWSVGIVAVMIAAGLGSLRLAAISLPPNLLGQLAVGGGLYALGRGLDYPTAVAMIVAFGLSVDDTIHVLSRIQSGERAGDSTAMSVLATLRERGPVVAASAAMLCLGASVTLISDLPTTRDFGIACMLTLTVGILGDLVQLPALLLAGGRWRRRRR